MKLKGKVAAITGGARGIGHSTAVKFAAEGARVAVCDINPELIEQTLQEIRSTGGEADGYQVDVTNKEQIAAMVKAVMAKTWARELGLKGIRAIAVCPGFITTPILSKMPEDVLQGMAKKVPNCRLGTPEEVANVFAFLASDDASYINGAVISVDGGMTI